MSILPIDKALSEDGLTGQYLCLTTVLTVIRSDCLFSHYTIALHLQALSLTPRAKFNHHYQHHNSNLT